MDLDTLKLIARAVYYGICVAAVLRGDRPLRYVGTTLIASALLSPLAQRLGPLDQPQYGVLLIDIAALVALAVILVRDRRWWLVVTASFAFISTLTHVAALIGTPISPYAVATTRLIWNYAKISAVAGGLIAHERNRRFAQREDVVRALIAEQGEARTRAELDRRYLIATAPGEKAEAARLVEALGRLATRQRDSVS
jgi:hypothetical protein